MSSAEREPCPVCGAYGRPPGKREMRRSDIVDLVGRILRSEPDRDALMRDLHDWYAAQTRASDAGEK